MGKEYLERWWGIADLNRRIKNAHRDPGEVVRLESIKRRVMNDDSENWIHIYDEIWENDR